MGEWPEGFDLAALLTPISAEAPAGKDLRQDYSPDSLYYRLRDARSEARAALSGQAPPYGPFLELWLKGIARTLIDRPRGLQDRPDRDRLAIRRLPAPPGNW